MLRVLLAFLLALPAAAAPSKKPRPMPGPAGDALTPVVDQVVRDYVRDQTEEEGNFALEDDLLGRTWELILLSVRTDDIRRHADGRVSVCAMFRGADEKNSQPVDVDFVLSGSDGEWTVDETVIHKVGKTARFTYNAKKDRVPVKGKAPKKKAPAEPGE